MADAFDFNEAIRLTEQSRASSATDGAFDRALAAYYLAKELEASF